MVKLRFPRSPFKGGGSAADETSDETNNNIDTNDRPRSGGGMPRPSSTTQLRRSRRLQQQRSTISSISSLSVPDLQAPPPAANQRRPFNSAESFSSNSSGGVASGIRRILTTTGKKKQRQSSNSISNRQDRSVVAPSAGSRSPAVQEATASSASRSLSSPSVIMHAAVAHAGGADRSAASSTSFCYNSSTTANSNNTGMEELTMQGMLDDFDSYDTEEGMDTSDDGGISEGSLTEMGPNSPSPYEPLIRSVSHEENIPPLALLSPNHGTYYAHAAASFKSTCSMDVDGDKKNSVSGGKSVMDWMRDDAPKDVLPKILSFLGSRKLQAISKVNRSWNAIVHDESVWRVMCEDTHKWVEGDKTPQSWLRHYRENPCVPIDYDTVDAAVDSISSGRRFEVSENNIQYLCREQRKSGRILLHPGPYFLRRSLVFNCVGRTELSMETVTGFKDPEHAMKWSRNYHNAPSELFSPGTQCSTYSSDAVSTTSSEVRRSTSLRQLFGCRFSSAAVDTSNHEDDDESRASSLRSEFPFYLPGHSSRSMKNGIPCYGPNPSAYLILESRRQNEPVIRIRQGKVNLRGLKLLHYCLGNDIWNGNAAVQVQSPFEDDRPVTFVPPSVAPTALVSDCDIVSLSGRGFVNIDGGISRIENCNIHNSAATGIYVGGTGSVATITNTDVIENGNGNERNRRGVARGHSGIYVEQGIAKIRDCNISKNSLTGISAVSSDHATLQLEDSDIVANGSVQLELPPIGSPSRGRSFTRNNNISAAGHGRPRSRYVKEIAAAAVGESPGGPVGGHFPPLPQSPSEFPNDSVVARASYQVGDVAAASRLALF